MRGLIDAWLRLPANSRGIVWILGYCVFFACSDAIAKQVGQTTDLLVLLLLRYVFAMMFIAPVVAIYGRSAIRTQRPGVHAVRTLLAVAAQLLLFYGLVHLYLADVTAITFARPLFVTLLAVLLLSERVSWQRWSATALGFAGVLIMVRPTSAGIDPAALAVIGATIMFGIAFIMVRRYAVSESPLSFVFYYHAGGCVLSLAPALYFWETPSLEQTLLIVAIAFMSTIAQTCGIRAYSVAPASVVSPIEYFRLIVAALIGLLVFAEVPGPATWAGSAIIVACALYITRREARERRAVEEAS